MDTRLDQSLRSPSFLNRPPGPGGAVGLDGTSSAPPAPRDEAHGAAGLSFAWDRAAGGVIGITPPSNRNTPRETGGEDTLELSLYVSWPLEVMDRLEHVLGAGQRAARGDDEGVTTDLATFDGRQLRILPVGARGKGRVAPYYAWVAEHDGIRLKIAARAEPHPSIPNVAVAAGSLTCMRLGVSGIWDTVQAVIGAMGGTVERDKVSRVDLAADMPGMPAAWVASALIEERVITYARKRAFYMEGQAYTGVMVGSGKLLMRAYDKVAELRANPDDDKRQYLRDHRWGGRVPDCALRVEFQLRREAIKSFGVDSVEDWIAKRAGVAAELTQGWFRVVDDAGRASGNQSRATVTSEWHEVMEAFTAWAGAAPPAARAREVKPEVEALTPASARLHDDGVRGHGGRLGTGRRRGVRVPRRPPLRLAAGTP